MNYFWLVTASFMLFLIVAFIVVKGTTTFLRMRKRHEKGEKIFGAYEKNIVIVIWCLIYLLLILYSILTSMEAGDGIMSGLKYGLLLVLANTVRSPYRAFLIAFLVLAFIDRKNSVDGKH